MDSSKHVGPQEPSFVGQLDTHFGGARVGVEQFGDIGDAAGQTPIGVGVQLDFGAVAQMNARQVIFEHIAKNPDIGEIRDGEQIGRVVEGFYSGGGSDVLLDDGSRHGRVNFNRSEERRV